MSKSNEDKALLAGLLKETVQQNPPEQKIKTITVRKEKQEGQRQLNFWVPADFKRALDTYVASEDTNIKEFIQVAVKEYWAKRNYNYKR